MYISRFRIVSVVLGAFIVTASSAQDTVRLLPKDSLKNEVFVPIDESAYFPGGMGALYKWIGKNINLPASLGKGQKEKVFVEFVINTNGEIDDELVRINRGAFLGPFNEACEVEGVRLLRACPDWKPAMQKGKPVRQRLVLPITFIGKK